MINTRSSTFMLCVMVLCGNLWADRCEEPGAWMEAINKKVFEAISQDVSDDAKSDLITEIFKPNLDVELFTKKIVGRVYWQEASESDRQQLQKSLYEVMLSDYTEAIVQTLAKKPHVHRVRPGSSDNMSTVTIAFHTKREKILLANFSLQCKNAEWKIFDISVEGVRLTDMQHEKFKKILRESGVVGLNEYLTALPIQK